MLLKTPNGDKSIKVAARPYDPWSAYSSLATDTFTGRDVLPEDSLAIAAVYGAVTLISESCGTLPLETIDQSAGKNVVVENAAVARMLRHQPNADMPAVVYWPLVYAHMLLRGNHYSAKLRGADGFVNELYPLLPDSVKPFRDEQGRKLFRVTIYDGNGFEEMILGPEHVLHFMGPSFDNGLTGASPMGLMRNRLGVALAQSEYQARFYANGAMMDGVLSTPGDLSPDAAERIKAQWRAKHTGLANRGDIAVLHSGAQYQELSMSPEDQQLIQSMKWGSTEIATAFNLPASSLNAEGSSMTYSNVEQDKLLEATRAFVPRIRRVEGALNADRELFGVQSVWIPRVNTRALLRGDTKTRFEAYETGMRAGWLHSDEVREWEDLPPREMPAPAAAPVPPPVEEEKRVRERLVERDAPSVINVTVPAQPAPIVNLRERPAPIVNVHVPEQKAPVVNVTAPAVRVDAPVVNVAAPDVRVDVAAPNVQVEPQFTVEPPASKSVKFQRDGRGNITGAEVEGG